MKAYFELARKISSKRDDNWAAIIYRLQDRNVAGVNNFEKIDFSLPGDSTYGDDPENEFFNPNGKFKARPIPQELIDQATTAKNSRIHFGLRRSHALYRENTLPGDWGNGYVDQLFAFIPDVPLCPLGANVVRKAEFKLAENHRQVIEQEDDLIDCSYKDDPNHLYLFFPVATR